MMSIYEVSNPNNLREGENKKKFKNKNKKCKTHIPWHQLESAYMPGKTGKNPTSFILNSDTNIYTKLSSHKRMESTEPVKAK